jgi:hypothetical protein
MATQKQRAALPPGHYAHPDPAVDGVIRDMVVDHRCEVFDGKDPGWIYIECPCPKRHLMPVEMVAPDTWYASRLIADLRQIFTCC